MFHGFAGNIFLCVLHFYSFGLYASKMARTKLPIELIIRIADFLEPAACYCFLRAFDGLDELLLPDVFTRKARPSGDTLVHLAASKGDECLLQTILARRSNVQTRNKQGVTPLACAARRGHQTVVKQLIAAGAKVDELDNRGLTALHCAAYHGSDMVVQLLLDAGADISTKAPCHGTALHMAARNGHNSTVSLLLEKGRWLQDITDTYNGALDLAAEYGRTAVVQQLIEAGFQVSDKTLQVAVSSGRAKIVKILLSQRSFPEHIRRAELFRSVELGVPSVVRLLVGTGLVVSGNDIGLARATGCSGSIRMLRLIRHMAVDFCNQIESRFALLDSAAQRGHGTFVQYLADLAWLTPELCKHALKVATWAGHSAVVKSIVACGLQVDEEDKRSALEHASSKGDLAIVDLLLDPGAQFDRLALYPAVCEGQFGRVRTILQSGINTSTPDWGTDILLRESLWKGAESGYTSIVELLLSVGVAPDVFRYGGTKPSALYRASARGHGDVVDLLVRAGADISREYHYQQNPSFPTEKHGYTALHSASRSGHGHVIDYLIRSGAPVSFQGAEGFTALHAAARSGHASAVNVLIHAGADLSIQANSGATSLHYAVQYNYPEVVKLLLDAGANPAALDHEGKSALNRAVEFQNAEVIAHFAAAEIVQYNPI
jgi:ankyrin repeat protein